MEPISTQDAVARVEHSLALHDPKDVNWCRASVDLARDTSVSDLLEQHSYLRRLQDIHNGFFDQSAHITIESQLTDFDPDLLLDVLDFETEDGDIAPGQYCGGLDPINAVPTLNFDGELISLLALPGEPVDAWPVVYSYCSSSQSHVIALDLLDLFDGIFSNHIDFTYPFSVELDEYEFAKEPFVRAVIPLLQKYLFIDADRALRAYVADHTVPEQTRDWVCDLHPPGSPPDRTYSLEEIQAAMKGAYKEPPMVERRVPRELYRRLDALCVRADNEWKDAIVPPEEDDSRYAE